MGNQTKRAGTLPRAPVPRWPNRRLERHGSRYRYAAESHSGSTWLYRNYAADGVRIAMVTGGTKREVAEFLHAVMVGIDDACAR